MSESNNGNFEVRICGPYRFTRNLGGTIYLVCGGRPFPGDRWFDLPVIILGWWVEAAIQLRLGRARRAEFLFMDGPFVVRVDKRLSQWNLVGVRKRDSGEDDVLVECAVSEREALETLHRAASELVETCHREQWTTDDLSNLERQLPDLLPG